MGASTTSATKRQTKVSASGRRALGAPASTTKAKPSKKASRGPTRPRSAGTAPRVAPKAKKTSKRRLVPPETPKLAPFAQALARRREAERRLLLPDPFAGLPCYPDWPAHSVPARPPPTPAELFAHLAQHGPTRMLDLAITWAHGGAAVAKVVILLVDAGLAEVLTDCCSLSDVGHQLARRLLISEAETRAIADGVLAVLSQDGRDWSMTEDHLVGQLAQLEAGKVRIVLARMLRAGRLLIGGSGHLTIPSRPVADLQRAGGQAEEAAVETTEHGAHPGSYAASAPVLSQVPQQGGPEFCPHPCIECEREHHHFGDAYLETADSDPDAEPARLGHEAWYQCKHCTAWRVELEDDEGPEDELDNLIGHADPPLCSKVPVDLESALDVLAERAGRVDPDVLGQVLTVASGAIAVGVTGEILSERCTPPAPDDGFAIREPRTPDPPAPLPDPGPVYWTNPVTGAQELRYEIICGCAFVCRCDPTPERIAALEAGGCPGCGTSWARAPAAAPAPVPPEETVPHEEQGPEANAPGPTEAADPIDAEPLEMRPEDTTLHTRATSEDDSLSEEDDNGPPTLRLLPPRDIPPPPESAVVASSALALPDGPALADSFGTFEEVLAALPSEARANLEDLDDLSKVYEEAAVAKNTRRVYRERFKLFVAWCRHRSVRAVPAHPEVLRCYAVDLAERKKAMSTIEVSLAAVNAAHRALGHEAPASERLRTALRGLRRTLGSLTTQPAAIGLRMLKQIISACKADLLAVRDRALLLVTFFLGLRREECAKLDREIVHRHDEGYLVKLGVTKGDQEGKGTPLGLLFQDDPVLCPVSALDTWLTERAEHVYGPDLGPDRGPVFVALHRGRGRVVVGDRLWPDDIDRVLKRRAEAADIDPSTISAHGLRAGLYTEVARTGAPLDVIRAHARHKRLATTLGYVRNVEVLSQFNPTFGLTTKRRSSP